MNAQLFTLVADHPEPFVSARREATRLSNLRVSVELLVRAESAVFSAKAAFKGEMTEVDPERADLRQAAVAELRVARDRIDMVLKEMG